MVVRKLSKGKRSCDIYSKGNVNIHVFYIIARRLPF